MTVTVLRWRVRSDLDLIACTSGLGCWMSFSCMGGTTYSPYKLAVKAAKGFRALNRYGVWGPHRGKRSEENQKSSVLPFDSFENTRSDAHKERLISFMKNLRCFILIQAYSRGAIRSRNVDHVSECDSFECILHDTNKFMASPMTSVDECGHR